MAKKSRRSAAGSSMEVCLAASVLLLVACGAWLQPALGVQAGLSGIGILMSLRAAEGARLSVAKRAKKRVKRDTVAVEQEARAGFRLLRFAPRPPVAEPEVMVEYEVQAAVRPRPPA